MDAAQLGGLLRRLGQGRHGALDGIRAAGHERRPDEREGEGRALDEAHRLGERHDFFVAALIGIRDDERLADLGIGRVEAIRLFEERNREIAGAAIHEHPAGLEPSAGELGLGHDVGEGARELVLPDFRRGAACEVIGLAQEALVGPGPPAGAERIAGVPGGERPGGAVQGLAGDLGGLVNRLPGRGMRFGHAGLIGFKRRKVSRARGCMHGAASWPMRPTGWPRKCIRSIRWAPSAPAWSRHRWLALASPAAQNRWASRNGPPTMERSDIMAVHTTTIDWQKDVDQAFEAARKSNRLVFVDFNAATM